MSRTKLYDDFVCEAVVERRSKHKSNGAFYNVEYSQFKCPYDGCGAIVEVPTRTVSTDKASKCGDHLKKNHQNDPRVRKKAPATDPSDTRMTISLSASMAAEEGVDGVDEALKKAAMATESARAAERTAISKIGLVEDSVSRAVALAGELAVARRERDDLTVQVENLTTSMQAMMLTHMREMQEIRNEQKAQRREMDDLREQVSACACGGSQDNKVVAGISLLLNWDWANKKLTSAVHPDKYYNAAVPARYRHAAQVVHAYFMKARQRHRVSMPT